MSQQQSLHQYFLGEEIPAAYEKYMVPAIFRLVAVRLIEMAQLSMMTDWRRQWKPILSSHLSRLQLLSLLDI